MEATVPTSNPQSLSALRKFPGAPEEFWPAYLRALGQLAGATAGVLLVRAVGDQEWEPLAQFGEPIEVIEEVAEKALAKKESRLTQEHGVLLGLHLESADTENEHVALLRCSGPESELVKRLPVLDRRIAVDYQNNILYPRSQVDATRLTEVLDLLLVLNGQTKHLSLAMALCNELSARFQAERVSVGWVRGDYVRLLASSHLQRFDKRMEAVRALELAMEEAMDQDEEISCPAHVESSSVSRNHASYSKMHGSQYLVSVPIRLGTSVCGVLTLERSLTAFAMEEVHALRLLCDLLARRMTELRQREQWWRFRAPLQGLLGPEHTWWKLGFLGALLTLGALVFIPYNYRVEATFSLRTLSLSHVPAPFEGFIEGVKARVGDQVRSGDALVMLDKRKLQIEEAEARADEKRYRSEADQAQAQGDLLQLRIALARAEQAGARAAISRNQIELSEVRAPIDGVIVEGDLNDRIGAPVQKGFVLMKVARIEGMYGELLVDEREIHELREGAKGQAAFSSRPELKFPFTVEKIEPVAVAHGEGNRFTVRVAFTQRAESWWRPGMSGVAKIEVGERRLLWVLTHRFVDFLRIKLWF